MKRKLCAWALIVSILLSMNVPVSSADAEAGFYQSHPAQTPDVSVEPCCADGPVEAVSRNVDGIFGDETFYPGSDRLTVTVSGAQPGAEYLLTVSEPETGKVCYLDQKIATRTAVFDVVFLLPEQRTELLLSVGSTADGFSKITIPISYTPAADDGTCPRDGACPMARYSDLDTNAWYHDGVHWALETGVMNGTGTGVFAPEKPVSRAMLVTMLWRMEGMPRAPGETSFADVAEGSWYAEAVRWAAAEGIVRGYGDRTFGSGDALTREQLAVILWRYAAWRGKDVTSGVTDRLGRFLDAEKISPWALEAMRWATHTELIRGVGADTLSPRTGAARAQTATLLMRFSALT